MMDQRLWSIWFSHIAEMQPLTTIIRDSPDVAAAIATFPAAAAVITLVMARDRATRGDFAFMVAAAELLVACAMMIAAAKMSMYAIWLGMPLVAAYALRLFAWLRITHLAARAFAALLLTPAVISAFAIVAVQAAGSPSAQAGDSRILAGCFKTASYAQLARLPVGVIATDIDFGSFVLALTPQAVVAAPYHRLGDGILAAYRIFALAPEEARPILARVGATYVVTCGAHAPPGLDAQQRAASLWGRLQAGAPPKWLERMPAQPGDRFGVYRIRS
jgi:hypothetical protein